MRMWMVPPEVMCRKHLLGEHVEIHMLAGSLRRGRSIAGFLAKSLLEPTSIRRRHAALVAEMRRRGFKHQSPLPSAGRLTLRHRIAKVDVAKSMNDLATRCKDCRLGMHADILRGWRTR